jgi:hypothetical protein
MNIQDKLEKMAEEFPYEENWSAKCVRDFDDEIEDEDDDGEYYDADLDD